MELPPLGAAARQGARTRPAANPSRNSVWLAVPRSSDGAVPGTCLAGCTSDLFLLPLTAPRVDYFRDFTSYLKHNKYAQVIKISPVKPMGSRLLFILPPTSEVHACVQRRIPVAPAHTSIACCWLYLGAATVPSPEHVGWLCLGSLPASSDHVSRGLGARTCPAANPSCSSAHERWLLLAVPRSRDGAVPNTFGCQKLLVGLPCLRLWWTRCTHAYSGKP